MSLLKTILDGNEREIRRAREIDFRCRGVMLLGTPFPILAVREGDDWRRKAEPSVGDIVFTEASDLLEDLFSKGGGQSPAQHAGAQLVAELVDDSRPPPCSHGAAKLVRLAGAEARRHHGQAHDLLLEKRYPQGLGQHLPNVIIRIRDGLSAVAGTWSGGLVKGM